MTRQLTDDQEYYLTKAMGLVAITVAWRRGELPARSLADMGLFKLVGTKEVPGLHPSTRAHHWTYSLTDAGRRQAASIRKTRRVGAAPA